MERLEEVVQKSVSNPLSIFYLNSSVKEIEQTAVAVSVMGTTKVKLKEMAGLALPVIDVLEGERPEVAKVRESLRRLIYNAQNSSTKNRQASKALRELRDGLVAVRKIVEKGLGNPEPVIKVGGFEIVNTWGYVDSEIRGIKGVLDKVSRRLVTVGLPTVATGLMEFNPKKINGSLFGNYFPKDDLFVFDLGRSGSSDLASVLRLLAERLWLQEFGKGEKETWGNGKGMRVFTKAFADRMMNERMSADSRARLQVTVGKLAANWPSNGGV